MYNIIILRSNGVKPDSRVEKEACSLIKAGHLVKILAWDRDTNYKEKNEKIMVDGIQIPIVRFGIKAGFGEGLKNLRQFLVFQIRMGKWLFKNRKKYNCIHACDFDTAFTGSTINLILRKKFIFDIFDYLSTDAKGGFRRLIKKLENHIINIADATIICTEQRREQIKAAKPKKLVVIHNSPAMPRQLKTFDLRGQAEKTKIAYVGILQNYRLLEEMTAAVEREPSLELHVGGFGKLENFFKANDTKNSNIFYYGRLKYEDTLSLENSCDIMTAIYDPRIGNHRYAAPNKFYEALMLGKPVIMIEGTGMSDVVKKEEIGIIIPYDEMAFLNAVKEIETKLSTAKGNHLKERMQNIYNDRYSWTEMEHRLSELYENL